MSFNNWIVLFAGSCHDCGEIQIMQGINSEKSVIFDKRTIDLIHIFYGPKVQFLLKVKYNCS